MPCVTSGIEISNIIATNPKVLSFKLGLCSSLVSILNTNTIVTIETVTNPLNAIEGQITSYFRRDFIVEHDKRSVSPVI